MRTTIVAALTIGLMIGGAQAQSSYDLADQLAAVLASEEFCGLTYNEDAVAGWIETNVPADDMEFTNSLQALLTIKEYGHAELAGAGKMAHCTQTKRVARSLGFVE